MARKIDQQYHNLAVFVALSEQGRADIEAAMAEAMEIGASEAQVEAVLLADERERLIARIEFEGEVEARVFELRQEIEDTTREAERARRAFGVRDPGADPDVLDWGLCTG